MAEARPVHRYRVELVDGTVVEGRGGYLRETTVAAPGSVNHRENQVHRQLNDVIEPGA